MSTSKIVHVRKQGVKFPADTNRLTKAAQLAAGNCITETPFGWHVNDPNGKQLVIWVEPFFVCGCKSETCPHTLAVTIYDRAAKRAEKESQAGKLDLVTQVVASRIHEQTNSFDKLTLQAYLAACHALSDASVVASTSSIFIDPELTLLEERLDDLFCPQTKNTALHPTISDSWPKRIGPARPTDQWSGQLPEEEIKRLFGVSDETQPPNGYHPGGYVTNLMHCLYERTTDTFSEEITSEIFNDVLGVLPHEKENALYDAQMQPLYERFVDTFGQTSTFSLFADAFSDIEEELEVVL